MRALLQDLYYTSRLLRKSLGFTLTAVLTLAVGIGGVTAVFSIVESVMLRPLPFQDSGRLVSLHERFEQESHELGMSAPDPQPSSRQPGFLRCGRLHRIDLRTDWRWFSIQGAGGTSDFIRVSLAWN